MIPGWINNRWELALPEHRVVFHRDRPWWEAARLSDMHYHLKPGMKILDVGSEEGDFTALYALWGCEVTFIDPSFPWTRQTIEILRANGLQRLLNGSFVGLAAEKTDLRGKKMGQDARFHTMDEPIRRVSVDDAFDIVWDAITMDVEGAELEVLRGAKKTLFQTRPMVWVSIHGEVDPHAEMPSEVHAFMRSLGYRDQFLAYDHEWHYRFWKPK